MLRNMFMAFLLISSIKKRFKKKSVNRKRFFSSGFFDHLFKRPQDHYGTHCDLAEELPKKEEGKSSLKREKEKNNDLQTSGKEFNLTSNKQGFTI